MNVHFMAVPADRMVAVDIPVAVYKILHVTVVLLTTCLLYTSDAADEL